MSEPSPIPCALQRQVELLRRMGGPSPVPGYSAQEQADAADRIARALARAADQISSRTFGRPR